MTKIVNKSMLNRKSCFLWKIILNDVKNRPRLSTVKVAIFLSSNTKSIKFLVFKFLSGVGWVAEFQI